jgi:molybdate transport system substrate-binding protein
VKDKVALVGEFPESSHPHISYPMAVVKSDNGAEAARFAAFVKSPEARAVFKRLGFIMQ